MLNCHDSDFFIFDQGYRFEEINKIIFVLLFFLYGLLILLVFDLDVDLRAKPYNRWNALAGHSILEVS